ncbi:DUF2515 domain-containing protein [Paenibacillus glycanilyticus]|uniref:DUF2515 domain-containing protein n=1 Tax=Paenibacillus glycanilyticus TaxID=126569 RepID=UPI002042514F|nr:DUF2515 domain-containing protein [Paenibacillus glycanilyticus]MCM3626295.1 DUF2515 domain-containing protein [Paenibacillus glycanilyticus]
MHSRGRRRGRSGFRFGKIKQLFSLPAAAWEYAIGKWHGMEASHEMLAEAVPLQLAEGAVAELTEAWLKLEGQPAHAGMTAEGETDRLLIERILAETSRLNRNNVTRTEAYRLMYQRHPELHWAMLAHLVSRNGGWNMTDLAGEWLPRLLPGDKRQSVFLLLEHANAFIFGDAYPQLLLYEESVRVQRPLFHLLPAFGVTRFMRPVWEQFWQRRDSAPLTVALIVNEQHFIEQRVVQDEYFRKNVIDTFFFGMQSLLQLNAVMFPYHTGGELRLAGLIMEHFDDLAERIEFGKALYGILFGVPRIREGALDFAAKGRHTGSRVDYAPQLFARIRHEAPAALYKERLLGGKLLPGAAPLYSPELGAAWANQSLEAAEPGDWFRSAADIAPYFRKLKLPRSFELTNEYGLLLNKIELAVLAAQQLRVEEPGARGE